MDSSAQHNYHHQQHQNHQPSSGLLRFRSAPSSLLANFTDNGISKGDSSEGFELERPISRFVSSDDNDSASNFQEFEDKRVTEAAVQFANSQQGYTGLPPYYPRHSSATSSSAMDSTYGLIGSVAMDCHSHAKRVDSSLVRQNSSPAGLFANISVQNGYANMKGVGNYGGVSGSNGEVSPTTNRLSSHLSLSSRHSSSLGVLPQISEIGNESIGAGSPDGRKLGNSNGDTRFYGSSFPYGPWNDSSHFAAEQDHDGRLYSSGAQNGDLGKRVHILSHHLSFPKTSAEMVAVEKFLHFQDSVPCKIRAKRGCATHPRSIAERVRRTRISERMRKLQELVPNMDKQTNTADMLDLAVDYIKDLQKQFKTLSDNRANCKCLSMQKPAPNQII